MKLRLQIAVCKTHTEACHATLQKVCVFPNMEIIFEFNNLRFSPEMFCHISVITKN